MGHKMSMRAEGQSTDSQSDVVPVTLAYTSYKAVSAGDSAPIFVIHGLFGSKANWNTAAKHLAAATKRTIVTLDLRNHGESPHTPEFTFDHVTEDIKFLLKHLKAEKGATFIGHSLGGRAVMHLASKYPGVVKDMVVVDISPLGKVPNMKAIPNIIKGMMSVRLESKMVYALARNRADKQLAEWVENAFLRQFLLTNLVFDEEAGGWAWKVNLEAVLHNYKHLLGEQAYGERVDKKTLFLGGTDSDFLPRSHEPKIMEVFPKAQLQYIEGGSHLLHIEKLPEFVSAINKFLTNTE